MEEQGLTRLRDFQKGSRSIGIYELSDLFEITPEALRKYEAKQILQPFRDKNGYRKYVSWDLTKLIRTRQLRQEGFSLNTVAAELSRGEPQQHLQELETIRQTLAQEIVYRKRLLAWMDSRRDDLLRAEHLGERCIVERQPRQYCCVYMVGDSLVAKEGPDWEHLKEWIQSLPFARVCYYVGSADDPTGAPLSSAPSDTLSCLSLGEEELKQYGLQHLTPDFILPAGLYAVCNMTVEYRSGGNGYTFTPDIAQARRKAESLGLPLSGLCVMQMMRRAQREHVFYSYNKIMFLIDAP